MSEGHCSHCGRNASQIKVLSLCEDCQKLLRSIEEDLKPTLDAMKEIIRFDGDRSMPSYCANL